MCCTQRRLLERLAALCASVLGGCVPVGAATLEALGLLLEVLGEVSAEAVALLGPPLAAKLTCGHGLLRAQACMFRPSHRLAPLNFSPHGAASPAR